MPPANEGKKRETRKKLPNTKPHVDTAKAAAWLLTEDAFQWKKGEKERRGISVDEARIRADLNRWGQLAILRQTNLDAANLQASLLEKAFNDKLTKTCKERNLDMKKALSTYVSSSPESWFVWPIQREHAHRINVESRVRTGQIKPQDVPRWVDWKDGNGHDVPIYDWIYRDECLMRNYKPNGSPIKSGRPDPPLGRFSLTPQEKRAGIACPKHGKTGKGVAYFPNVKGLPWILYTQDWLEKISPAYDDFIKWRTYLVGPHQQASDSVRQVQRDLKERLGLRNARAPSPPRNRDPERIIVKRCREGTVRDPLQTNINFSDDPAENHFLQEEMEQLQSTFELLSIHAGGEWEQSVTWMTEILLMLDECDCLVWDDDETHYELPNGRTFRSLSDKMSYRSDEFKACMRLLDEKESELEIDPSGLVTKVFSLNGEVVFKMKPFAARAHASTGLLKIDFPTAYLYYQLVYDELKIILDDWQMAHDSENGGADIESTSIRQYLPDDPVYGSEMGCMRHEPLPDKINGSVLLSQTRVRRCRYEGDDGLPETIFRLIAEANIGCGWMAWVNDAFHMKDPQTGIWKELPENEGVMMRLGWMPGDELPEEDHDYVKLTHKLALAAKELPPLFA